MQEANTCISPHWLTSRYGKKRKRKLHVLVTSKARRHIIHALEVSTYPPKNRKLVWLKVFTFDTDMHAITSRNITVYNTFYLDVKARYYYTCCRDGKYRQNIKPRKTKDKRLHQKDSRKINNTCISKMYVDEFADGHVEVTFIPAHTGHELGRSEIKQLPLPQSTKEGVVGKLSLGIPPTRILDG